MKASELVIVLRGIAPVIVEQVEKAVGVFAARLTALEQRMATVRDGVDGQPGERGEKGDKGDAGTAGHDGADGAPGPQGEKGDPGERGPEGPAGRDGRDGQPGVPGLQGEKGADGINGRDGADGKDGRDGADGLGFDDIEVEHDGERSFTLKFVRGERVKVFGAFTIPSVLDRGVYRPDRGYAKGDGVSWDGCFWIAQKDTSGEKPGQGATAWRLAVKRGSDGKQGPEGKPGPQGPQGPRGNDGRHGF